VPELYPNDQQKVDDYLVSNVNSTERKPFRPLLLLAVIAFVLLVISAVGFWVALNHGVV
jgi:hypothetical protein